MKKCVFIIPYFGKFNNYFNLFLLSCKKNKNFNWLIFTDDKTEYDYPDNVKVIYMNFDEIKKIIQSKFDFKINLDRPYKLCDFKPTYGYVFSNYINDYSFWGHCDLDMILGNLEDFITDDLLSKYDKLFVLGHMTLYRNTDENNKRFMLPFRGENLYKDVLQDNKSRNFDEEWHEKNVNSIFLENKFKVFQKDYSANPCILPNRFILTKYDSNSKKYINEKYVESIYVWDDGDIYRIYKKNNSLIKEKFIYMHLQQRKMKNFIKSENPNIFKIAPNSFRNIEYSEINEETFSLIRKNYFNNQRMRIYYRGNKAKLKKLATKLFGGNNSI